jgi:WD40 repeat protein
VNTAAFSGDGTRVVTASWDGTARIWDAESGKEIALLKGHTGVVSSAAFSASSRLIDLNGETNSLKRKKSSAIIAVDVRRFGHAINRNEVFGTHTGLRFTQPALLCAYQ